MTIDITKLRAETLALIRDTTPGPWFSDCWDILGSGAWTGTGSICEVAYPNGDDDQYWKHGEADANARLIAATPTLASDTLRLLDEIEARDAEIDRLKAELAKANNEFGSQTPDWPDLWKRIADLKEISNDRWRENERLTAENERLKSVLREVIRIIENQEDGVLYTDDVIGWMMAFCDAADLVRVALANVALMKGEKDGQESNAD